jgi:hypothetical protein
MTLARTYRGTADGKVTLTLHGQTVDITRPFPYLRDCLAYALLQNEIGESCAKKYAVPFHMDVVSLLPPEWELTSAQIREAVGQYIPPRQIEEEN